MHREIIKWKFSHLHTCVTRLLCRINKLYCSFPFHILLRSYAWLIWRKSRWSFTCRSRLERNFSPMPKNCCLINCKKEKEASRATFAFSSIRSTKIPPLKFHAGRSPIGTVCAERKLKFANRQQNSLQLFFTPIFTISCFEMKNKKVLKANGTKSAIAMN